VNIPGLDELPHQQKTTMSRVRAVIRGNRHLSFREVADEVGISIGCCHQIFYLKSSDVSRQFKIRAAFVD